MKEIEKAEKKEAREELKERKERFKLNALPNTKTKSKIALPNTKTTGMYRRVGLCHGWVACNLESDRP